ncbi:enoyl-CoA hydratase/isomerase family protein [Caballeronia ptereochthonis]|uniref:Short chain enoyl-CoA hydratase n=1 Tax=Caballeronia ptereochthonis TaxID=1777144 RepID=A0A158AXB1_9BURK|nr:enoyl-CoA hydratase-related protein [Caballeronia ptereochthonis]SAK62504.1 short chain enoyl-CoA hydratase [Caballeronia ptereochthonis]
MSEAPVIVENHDDGVTVITLNRAHKKNAMSRQAALDVQRAFDEFDRSAQRVAIFTGAGDDAFCAGADLNDKPEFWRCTPTVGFRTEKPVIAAIGGWCIGGGLVFAMMSDLAVASESAIFQYPEARLGFTGGIIASMAGRIPHKFAMEVMMLGRRFNAERAMQMGLVNAVTPRGEHVNGALAIAREIAQAAPLVLAMLKRSVVREVVAQSPAESMARTLAQLTAITESADAKEGPAAFREKRAPVYRGA